jgi:plasmid stabilization system protein ParE
MNVRLLGAAWSDAFDVAEWYDQQSSGTGDRFLAAIDQLVDDLARHPRLYGRVNRPPRGREIRQAPVPGFQYLATYEIIGNEVVVLSVTHGRSRRQPWRQRLPDPPTS